MKAFSGAKEGASPEDMLKNINDDGLKSVQKIIDATLKESYPEEPEEMRKKFGLKYMPMLVAKIFEMNSADNQDGEAIRRMKNIQKIRNDTKPTSESQG